MPEGSDTQWPRFEVFQQARPGASLANVGSVHAPDAEMALQNARDVFVRRPQTYRLWVVPAGAILARTAQELQQADEAETETMPAGETAKEYHVFRKTDQRRSMTYVELAEELVARSPRQALSQAIERAGDEETTYVWWIVPADAVVASSEDDVESMFEPARDKTYRMPSEYPTTTMMREVKREGDEDQA